MLSMSLNQKTVLIVDDMMSIRVKLRKLCTDMGIGTIYEAPDGQQALDLINSRPVDLVLSDWNMPNMNGLSFLQKMRANEKFKQLPVIFITSENEKASILQALVLGVTDYIVKPFTDDAVIRKVSQVLGNENKG